MKKKSGFRNHEAKYGKLPKKRGEVREKKLEPPANRSARFDRGGGVIKEPFVSELAG